MILLRHVALVAALSVLLVWSTGGCSISTATDKGFDASGNVTHVRRVLHVEGGILSKHQSTKRSLVTKDIIEAGSEVMLDATAQKAIVEAAIEALRITSTGGILP